jgi:hypothetical protein
MTAIAVWTKTLSSFIDPGIEEIKEIDSNIGIKRKRATELRIGVAAVV